MRPRSLVAAALWAGPSVIAALVWFAGGRGLGGAPLTRPSGVPAWWSEKGPVVAVFDILRLAIVAGGIYWSILLVATLLGICAGRIAGLAKRSRFRDWSGLSGMARLLARTSFAGASLVVGTTIPLACGSAATPDGARTNPNSAPMSGPGSAPRLIPLEPVIPDVGTSVVHTPPAPSPLAAPPLPPAPPAVTGEAVRSLAGRWTVRPGDDLWTIASSTLESRLGRRPSDQEIGPYWLKLIRLNRPSLPDPDNPSLIFAGDSIALP